MNCCLGNFMNKTIGEEFIMWTNVISLPLAHRAVSYHCFPVFTDNQKYFPQKSLMLCSSYDFPPSLYILEEMLQFGGCDGQF